MEVVGRKFSHRPGNPATVGVVRWPAAGDTAGSSLRRLSSLQHRIYDLLDRAPELSPGSFGPGAEILVWLSLSVPPVLGGPVPLPQQPLYRRGVRL